MEIHTVGEFIIEVLDSSEVPPSELSQFEETLPIAYGDIAQEFIHEEESIIKCEHEEDSEERLIQKFVSGEVEFPDVYTRLDADEDDDIPLESQSVISEEILDVSESQTQSKSADNCHDTSGFEKRRKPHRPSRKKHFLNATLAGLMGEANLCFARGQAELAEKICLEIIRQNPLAPEPFFTMAEIYENRDKEKYMNFLTIAAHLDPHNKDQWVKIAEMYFAMGNYARAKVYYSKAIKYIPKEYDLRLRKGKIQELLNEHTQSMYNYLKMIPLVPAEQGELCMETAMKVSRHFYGLKRMPLALEAMEGAYSVVPNLFTAEETNLYLELLLINKQYQRVVDVLKEQTDIGLITGKQPNGEEMIMFCMIPEHMIPDLRAKLAVALIHLKAFHLIDYLITNFHQFVPFSSRIDLYVDLVEAMMQEKKHNEALQLLEPIISGESFHPPAFVWLRYAECLHELRRYDEAIKNYFKVVEMAPLCYEAKFTLSALLKQQGRHRDAIRALEQDLEGEKINPRLLYERCLMLKSVGEFHQYYEVGYALLGRGSVKLRSREEMLSASNGSSFVNEDGVRNILETRLLQQEDCDDMVAYRKGADATSDLTISDEYNLFLDLIQTCYERKDYGMMEKIGFAMVTTKRFLPFALEIENILILSCYYNNDTVFSFSFLRDKFSKNMERLSVWNFYSALVQKGEDLRYHRFIKRSLARPRCLPFMRVFVGHYHLYCCSYKYALSIYVPIAKEYPDPILHLCTAVVFAQVSLQKKILRKPAATGQAIAFMNKYAENRMCPETAQEIYYNMGRLYQQAGMHHLAMDYYEKALAQNTEMVKKHKDILCLERQIAFNIHLIYRHNGNNDMARHYLYKYIVV